MQKATLQIQRLWLNDSPEVDIGNKKLNLELLYRAQTLAVKAFFSVNSIKISDSVLAHA